MFGVNVAKSSYRANMSFLREVVKKNAVVTEKSKDLPPENQGKNISIIGFMFFFLISSRVAITWNPDVNIFSWHAKALKSQGKTCMG